MKTDTQNKLSIGDTVKYRNPTSEAEAAFRFTLVEHNGDRVKIQWNEPLTEGSRFRPVECLPTSEVERANDQQCLMIPKALPLARKFSECVLRDVGVENHAELIRKTREILKNGGVNWCATHDYCDSNMSMLDAWNALGGSEPFCDMGSSEANEAARTLECEAMNAAWAIAKRNLFWLS